MLRLFTALCRRWRRRRVLKLLAQWQRESAISDNPAESLDVLKRELNAERRREGRALLFPDELDDQRVQMTPRQVLAYRPVGQPVRATLRPYRIHEEDW